jgi:uncharacterized low-complexity protein
LRETKEMKKTVTTAALALVLALGATAMGKTKHSAEHNAAVKKCRADYAAAVKDAKGKKGKEHAAAIAAAKKAEKDCIAAAPK